MYAAISLVDKPNERIKQPEIDSLTNFLLFRPRKYGAEGTGTGEAKS